MKRILLLLFALSVGLSLYAQPGQNIPAGAISNTNAYFDTLGARTPKGVTPVKQDSVLHIFPFKITGTTDTVWSILDSADILAMVANKIDSVSQRNDTVFYWRNNYNAYFTTNGSGTIPTLRQVARVIDLVRDYGADTTGVIDITSRLQAAVNTRKPVFIGPGIFNLAGRINLPDSSIVFGVGAKTILKIADTIAFNLDSTNYIHDLQFIGTMGSTGTTKQIAINMDTAHGAVIQNCWFRRVAGTCIKVGFTNTGSSIGVGFLINSCVGDSNNIGIFSNTRGEYGVINNCEFTKNVYGIYMRGGNTSIVGGQYTYNTYGFYLNGSGANDGHAPATGSKFNHNTYNVYCDSSDFGYFFDGCALYDGDIRLRKCTNVRFSDCDLSFATDDTFNIVNSLNVYFDNCPVINSSAGKYGRVVIDTSKVLMRYYDRGRNIVFTLKDSSFVVSQITGSEVVTNNLGVGSSLTPTFKFQTSATDTGFYRGNLFAQYANNRGGSKLTFRKSRGTETSPATIVPNDTTFSIMGEAHDGTGYVTMGAIRMYSSGTIATTRMPGAISLWTATDAVPSVLTERFKINQMGSFSFVANSTGSTNYTGIITDNSAANGTQVLFGWLAGGTNDKYKSIGVDSRGLVFGRINDALPGSPTAQVAISNAGILQAFNRLTVAETPRSNNAVDSVPIIDNDTLKAKYIVWNDTIANSSAGTLNFGRGGHYTAGGTTATYTLKSLATTPVGTEYIIKNTGSGNLTINTTAAANEIYDTAATNTLTVAAGASITLFNTGLYFITIQ